MNTRTSLALVSVLLIASACATSNAQETKPAVEVEIGAGGQLVDVDSDRPAKFEEYRDVPQGAILDWLSIGAGPDRPWSFRLSGSNLLRDDQRYDLELERPGFVQIGLRWDQIPHLTGSGGTFLLRENPGHYTLDPGLRGILETTADTSLKPLVEQTLATTAHEKDVLLRRDMASTWASVDLGAGFGLRVDAGREKRSGDKRISVGTYIRSSTTGAFDVERFTPRGLEMPEPTDYRTNEATVAFSWAGRIASARAGYTAARFRNEVDSIVWDNPFQVTPRRTFDWSSFSQADRGNFAISQLGLPPDHTYDRWFAGGAVSLPGRTRITGEYAVAQTEQDDPFLPFTLNTAVLFPGPDGILDDPTTATVESTDDVPAAGNLGLMPQRSLDGRYETKRGAVRVTTSFYRPLTLSGYWRSYTFEDERPELRLPGYVAFGDVAFRCGIGQVFPSQNVGRPANPPCLGGGILFNERGGYTRDTWGGGAVWRIAGPVGVRAEYVRETWDFDARQVERTKENTLTAGVDLSPSDWLTARLTWLDASKNFEGGYEIGLETSGIRAFDVWERDRRRYGADVDVTVGEKWILSGSYSNRKDEYPGAVETVTRFEYGLREATTDSASAGATFTPAPRLSIHASLGRESSEWRSLSVTKTSLTAANYDPSNRWSRVQDDTLNWGNLGFRADLVPDELELGFDYDLSQYDGEQRTRNEALPTVNSAVALSFPDLESTFHSARASLNWTLKESLRLQFRYWYEAYTLDDFSWDRVRPEMQGVIKELRGADPASASLQDANVVRYLFLDTRYSDYTAHVAAAVLSYVF